LHWSTVVQTLPSLHADPEASNWQVALQQSPATVFPSSHCSPQAASKLPLPQEEPLPTQKPLPLQVSLAVQLLPSLQGLPDASNWQALLQQSPPVRFPSSHCSPQATSRTPLPQTDPLPTHDPAPLHWSTAVQLLPSLHGAPTSSNRQVLLQQSPPTVFPSSHCSPHAASKVPLPQVEPAPTQRPAPLHASAEVQGFPSLQEEPEASNWHVTLQQSPPTVLPSSHCSPHAASKEPLPQGDPPPMQIPVPLH